MRRIGSILALSAIAMSAHPEMMEQVIYHEDEESKKRRNKKLNPNDIAIPKQIIPHVPNGTKEYFFNIEGVFSTKGMLKTECVFKCVASNDKNAKRKFDKWKSNQKTNT